MSLPPFNHDAHIKFTESSNTLWTFGQKIENTESGRKWLEGEQQGWKVINTAEDTARLYPLMISAIVPRPIAFVSSVSETGVENLAPFSWFNMVTHNPPLVSFCCSNTPRLKDTPTNVKNGLGFTVNIISEPFVENANAPSIHVKAPRVKESAFSMECELFQAIDITHPYIHVRKDVLNERGVIDIAKYKPIARLGDISFGRLGDVFRLPRLVWEQEKEKIEQALDTKEQS
ncbi:hypothetical protein EDC04DRAFT_2905670 [Pisolithus marmoratus]|nr:hypothetical protein EDC04DRAFT_2905670 [Pisolithus marmoratus]